MTLPRQDPVNVYAIQALRIDKVRIIFTASGAQVAKIDDILIGVKTSADDIRDEDPVVVLKGTLVPKMVK